MKENVIEIENGNRKRKRCLNCRERHEEKRNCSILVIDR